MSPVNISGIDHIGIAVKNLDTEKEKYRILLGIKPGGEETVPGEKVKVCFFQVGTVRIELLQGTGPESPVSRFIEKNGPGTHHIAFRVKDLESTVGALETAGFIILEPRIRQGAHGASVSFIHPRSTGGLLIELCQKQES